MNTSVLSSILNLDPQLVWRWYRDHLSDFRESESTGDHYRHDLQLDNGETVRVPICEPENFGKSMSIADKFHIIRSLMESCQDVRVRLRQDLLRDRRVKHTAHRKQEKERKKECQASGKEHVSQAFKYDEENLSNGETVLEALARSKYLLFKYADDWTCSQSNRAYALFDKFPEIRKVYDRCCEFRDWMKKENEDRYIRLIKNKLPE